jgi:hypothetical protein
MRRFVIGAAVVLACAGLVGVANAAAKKANPDGTWKWEVNFGGQSREMTLHLKHEGDKLTGDVEGRNGQKTEIEDGEFKDGKVSFKVTRERNGQKFTAKYEGKVNGDTIKGKVEFEREGQAQSRDWEAKRAKD